MARHIYQGTYKDGNGRVITSGTISVYLAGTGTAADVYTASAGGSAVNSVTSDTDGHFLFWVDDSDYAPTQLFKITLSKTNFTSKSYDNVQVYPSLTGSAQTIGGEKTFTSQMAITNASPYFYFNETGAGANNGKWRFVADSETFYFQTRNDANSAGADIFKVDRTGTVVDTFNVKATALQHNGNDVIINTGNQTIAGVKTFTDKVLVSSAVPRLNIQESDASANNKLWGFTANNEAFKLLVRNDAEDASASVFEVSRTDNTVDEIDFLPTNLKHNGVKVPTISSTDTLTNKTLTAPVISTISNTGTVTLPTDTDTLVGRATTDTLTNKTLTSPIINSPSSSGEVYSGTYSPTDANIANVTVSDGGYGTYIRTGDVCTVCVSDIIASATVGGTLTQFTLTLPIASSFTSTSQGAGAGAADSGSAIVAAKIEPYTSTNTLLVEYYPAGTGPNTLAITFTYRIL